MYRPHTVRNGAPSTGPMWLSKTWWVRRYVITKRETDPDILAAFAPLIGPDEQLGYGPADMFPSDACTCGGHR
jgi:hypothetical protein